MTEDPKKPRKPGQVDLNLGSLLGSLGEALGEAVQKLTEAGEAAADKIQETTSDHGPIRTHTGLRVRVGGLPVKTSRATPRPVNPERASTPGPTPRDLTLDLIEDGDHWIVTGELPGVLPAEVHLSLSDTRLAVTTSGARRYQGSVTLPAPCPVEAITLSLVNGILTLRNGATG